MPYSKNDELPKSVLESIPSGSGRELFRRVFNSSYAAHEDDGKAMAAAWSAIRDAGYSKNDEGQWVKKSNGAKTLYAYRPVLNGEEILEWARSQGIETNLSPDDLHVTVAYSKRPILWDDMLDLWDENLVVKPGPRSLEILGEDSLVLAVDSPDLTSDWAFYRARGASWDYPGYVPHVSLAYGVSEVPNVEPFQGEISLGGVKVEEIDEGYKERLMDSDAEKRIASVIDMDEKLSEEQKKGLRAATKKLFKRLFTLAPKDRHDEAEGVVLKADDEQRIVWGWASVSTYKGETVWDQQGDSISPDVMSRGATDFMENHRTAKIMHCGSPVGQVVHSMPLTKGLADALDISSDREGWVIGMKVEDEEVWKAVKDGVFKGFSIGGRSLRMKAED